MSLKIKKLIREIAKEHLDGFLVTNPVNVAYLTGFKPSESYLLITKHKKFFITDFRYEEEAKSKLKDWKLSIFDGSIFKTTAKLAKSCGIKSLGFEARHLPFAEYEKFKAELFSISFEPTQGIIHSIRMIKNKQEISLLKKAIIITLNGFDFVEKNLAPGVKEKDLALKIENFLKQQGAEAMSFDIIVASGPNSSYPHASVSSRSIQKNDLVLVDMGVSYKGYKSDLTRVFFSGKISTHFRRIYDVVCHAQKRAIRAIKPGVKISKIDKLSRDYISKKGWARNFRHSLGHGIGLQVHEEPDISCKNTNTLQENMVFTVEPAIYIPRKFGIRLEEIVLVTKKGVEILSGTRSNRP